MNLHTYPHDTVNAAAFRFAAGRHPLVIFGLLLQATLIWLLGQITWLLGRRPRTLSTCLYRVCVFAVAKPSGQRWLAQHPDFTLAVRAFVASLDARDQGRAQLGLDETTHAVLRPSIEHVLKKKKACRG